MPETPILSFPLPNFHFRAVTDFDNLSRRGFVREQPFFNAGAPDRYFSKRQVISAAPVGKVTYHPRFDSV